MTNKIKIGVLIYDKVQPLDAIGPWEVFAIWQKLNPSVSLCLISELGTYVECDSEIILKSHCSFADCEPLDYLIVPGGLGRLEQANNQQLIDFIKQQHQSCKLMLSVCTGAFLLAKAGLLKHHSATTYWRAIKELAEDKTIKMVPQRIVKSGKIWTAGGVSSGIDLAIELVKEISGPSDKDKLRLMLEYFPPSSTTCNLSLANELPAYGNKISSTQELPEYIIRQAR
jgi:transcriptional regulator GlxA family with amidase domain